MQRFGEVDLTAHRGFGDRAHLFLTAGLGREHLDHLTLNKGGVHVEHDEPLRATRNPISFDRDIDADSGSDLGQTGTQKPIGIGRGVGCGDLKFETGYRVVRDAPDGVDVGALSGKFAGDGAERTGGDGPSEHDDNVSREHSLADRVGTDLHVDVYADRRHRLFELFLEHFGVVGAGQ